MKLYRHQQKIVDEKPVHRCLVWEVGTGKTLALLRLAEAVGEETLVICPKGLMRQWEGKIKEYGIKVPITVVTKETARRDWEKLPFVVTVILDEVHHHSGYKSQMHKNLVKYLVRTRPLHVYSGTATPYRREPFNVYALARLHGVSLDWNKFRMEFYQPRWLGSRMIWEPKQDTQTREKLYGVLAQFCDFVRLEECFDMPEQIDEEPEEIELSEAQKEAIKKVKLEEGANPLVLANKIHQIESGSLKGSEFVEDMADLVSGKDDRVMEICEANDKVLIFCRYTLQIERLARKLNEAGHEVWTITGENSADHYAITLQAEESARGVVVAQIGVAAGWEVPSFKVVVYASMSYSYIEEIQSRGRVIRGNKLDRHVFIYLLGGPVDKAVLKCLKQKRDFDPAKFEV